MGFAIANAEGYQVNTLSARQGGMGHTGVALKLGSQSMLFNPAGMAYMDDKAEVAGSFNALKPYAKCQTGGKWYDSDNDVSTPIFGSVACSINKDIKAGVSFYTPYGSNINWGMDWPGAVMNQKVKLSSFTLQPTVSYRTPIRNLSVGAGLTMSWGTVDLYKALIDPDSFNKLIGAMTQGAMQWPTDMIPASANLSGNTSLTFGANVGVMYDVNDQWTVGADFRTTSWLTVKKGEAKVIYADAVENNPTLKTLLSQKLGGIDHSEFDAKMPMPYVFTVGAAYHPTTDWTVAIDAQLTGWHAYKTLDVQFHNPDLPKAFDQHIKKDYQSSWAFRFGAEHNLNDNIDLRAGIAIDQSPINDAHYNPETPGMTKLEPSIGMSYHIGKFTVDVAALYVAGLGVDDAICDYDDLLAKSTMAENPQLGPLFNNTYDKTFTGSYRLHAFNIAIGLSYKF